MNLLYLDTSALYALLDADDRFHPAVRRTRSSAARRNLHPGPPKVLPSQHGLRQKRSPRTVPFLRALRSGLRSAATYPMPGHERSHIDQAAFLSGEVLIWPAICGLGDSISHGFADQVQGYG